MSFAPRDNSDQPGHLPILSESLLCTQWVAKDSSFLHADSKASVSTGWMPRLIWVFAGGTCHFAGFVTRRLKSIFCNRDFQLSLRCLGEDFLLSQLNSLLFQVPPSHSMFTQVPYLILCCCYKHLLQLIFYYAGKALALITCPWGQYEVILSHHSLYPSACFFFPNPFAKSKYSKCLSSCIKSYPASSLIRWFSCLCLIMAGQSLCVAYKESSVKSFDFI